MCLHNFNNKHNSDKKSLNDEEYAVLSQIYQSIASNDNERARELTEELITMQSSYENIKALQEALDTLK